MHRYLSRSAAGALLTLAVAAGCRAGDSPREASGEALAAQAAPSPVASTPPAADTPVLPASETAAPAPAARGAAPTPAARVSVFGVDLTGVGFDLGDPKAPVTVVEFSDFGCPYCAEHALQTFPALEKEFIRTGKVFYKQVPFVMGMFPNGDKAALAGECAAQQGKYWPMHDRLFAGQREWKRSRDPEPIFAGYAATAKLDTARFAACYRARGGQAAVDRNDHAAFQLDIRATPTFFINGHPVEGALPLEVFRQVLTRAASE